MATPQTRRSSPPPISAPHVVFLVAIPEAFEGGQVVQQARAINPKLPIIARAHSEAEIEHLAKHGANLVVMGEHEIAKAMIGHLPASA